MIFSFPFSLMLYNRSTPFSTNATNLLTSPSCRRYCFFLSFLGVRNVFMCSSSSPVSGTVSLNFWKNNSYIEGYFFNSAFFHFSHVHRLHSKQSKYLFSF